MKIVVDENLSPALARSLAALFVGQHEVMHVRDKFGAGIADKEWIEALSKEGKWVVISADRKITTSRVESQAFRTSNLVGFFFSNGLFKAPIVKQMERLMALWDRIEQQAGLVQGGAMFELPIRSTLLKQIK